jgi:CBS domain-containing protein
MDQEEVWLVVFVSDVLGQPIYNQNGDRLGRVRDLVILTNQPHALVDLIIIRGSDGRSYGLPGLAWQSHAPHLTAKVSGSLTPYVEHAQHILLARDVLDKQLIDVKGAKVERVNDIELESSAHGYHLVAVDAGARGFIRRLLGETLFRFVQRFGWEPQARLIAWTIVEPLGSAGSPIRLSAAGGSGLSELHPADLADIVDDLDRNERAALFASLDDETAADTLTEVETVEDQAHILHDLGAERSADILEEMSPDDVADLLAELPPDTAETILNAMEQEEREDVRALMEFDEDTAGGLMTTDYINLSEHSTTAQAIDQLRRESPEAETIYYLYVVDEQERLRGVVSLRDLIVASPETRVSDIMTGPVISVATDADEEEVVDLMSKYDFLALPVTDAEDRLVGIITVDDVMDVAMERGGWLRQTRPRR